jgi:hypothetical protein
LIALAQRCFETQRLPQALAPKAQVDSGERLSETDRQFLDELLSDMERSARLAAPETALAPIQQCAARLFDDILSRAWQNGTMASAEAAPVPDRELEKAPTP